MGKSATAKKVFGLIGTIQAVLGLLHLCDVAHDAVLCLWCRTRQLSE